MCKRTNDDRNKTSTYTHAIIVCVPDADLVVTLRQVVVIVRSVSPIIGAVRVTGIEGLHLQPSGVIDSDLKINVLQPANTLSVSDGKRIGPIQRNRYSKLNPGIILAPGAVSPVFQVVPTGVARFRRLVDVITGVGIGGICYNCCVGIVAKVGSFAVTPSVAAGDWHDVAALKALQGSDAIRIGIAISAVVCWDELNG